MLIFHYDFWSLAAASLPAVAREWNWGLQKLSLSWCSYIGIVATVDGFIIWFQYWWPGLALGP